MLDESDYLKTMSEQDEHLRNVMELRMCIVSMTDSSRSVMLVVNVYHVF